MIVHTKRIHSEKENNGYRVWSKIYHEHDMEFVGNFSVGPQMFAEYRCSICNKRGYDVDNAS